MTDKQGIELRKRAFDHWEATCDCHEDCESCPYYDAAPDGAAACLDIEASLIKLVSLYERVKGGSAE